MTLVVGIDVGGTKTHLRVDDDGTTLVDLVVPSEGWPPRSAERAARWLAPHIDAAVARAAATRAVGPTGSIGTAGSAGTTGSVAHVAVGAHGCETPEHCADLAAQLKIVLGLPCTVVNDAELLVPAAGLDAGIGLIAGTGSVAVGRQTTTGAYLSAGGWGWVLGDEGSASALVREAARALMVRADAGAARDNLEPRLCASFGVSDLVELAARMSWDGGVERWGEHAPVVFQAADAGSAVARSVVSAGGAALAELVGGLVYRGAAGSTVVVAGGVLTVQRRLREAFAQALARRAPGFGVVVLTEAPVAGAVVLARRAVAKERGSATERAVVTERGTVVEPGER